MNKVLAMWPLMICCCGQKVFSHASLDLVGIIIIIIIIIIIWVNVVSSVLCFVFA